MRAGDAVSPYLLSPGFFADKALAQAQEAGAGVVADVLGTHPVLVELLCSRFTALQAAAR